MQFHDFLNPHLADMLNLYAVGVFQEFFSRYYLLIDTRISYKFTYVDTSFYFKTLARRHSKFLLYADGLEWYFVTSNSG